MLQYYSFFKAIKIFFPKLSQNFLKRRLQVDSMFKAFTLIPTIYTNTSHKLT